MEVVVKAVVEAAVVANVSIIADECGNAWYLIPGVLYEDRFVVCSSRLR